MNHFKITTTHRAFLVEAKDIFYATNTAALLVEDNEEILGVALDPFESTYLIVEITV